MANLQQKKALVERLQQDVQDATVIIVADYRGLSVAEITELRRVLRPMDVRMTVAKNTLVKRAVGESAMASLAPHLKGPTALVVSRGDQVATVKAIKDFLKKNKKKNELRAGFLDGSALNAADVEELANMPSLPELRGKLLMCIASPLMGLAGVLHQSQASLVRALDQIAQQKEAS